MAVDFDFCRQYVKKNSFRTDLNSSVEDSFGIECELTPVYELNGKTKPMGLYKDASQSKSSAELILEVSKTQDNWNPIIEKDGGLGGVDLGKSGNISFEPGGQIEISTKPFRCLDHVLADLDESQKLLKQKFADHGIRLLHLGINPWHTIDEIGLQRDKARYQCMDQYFKSIGPFGQRMMRQTGTIQVNMDFGPTEEVLAKRYLLSQLLSPFATAIFANSPIASNKPTEYKTQRAVIWQNTDPLRTGFTELSKIAKNLNLETCVDAYLDCLLDSRFIFDQNAEPIKESVSLRDWVEGRASFDEDPSKILDRFLSLQFMEVRPKKFLEIRGIDGQPRALQRVPAALYAGLLYNEKSLDQALDYLLPHMGDVRANWVRSAYGLEDENLWKISKNIISLACEGFEALPECHRHPETAKSLIHFKEFFTDQKRSPADMLLEKYSKKGKLEIEDILDLESRMRELMNCR